MIFYMYIMNNLKCTQTDLGKQEGYKGVKVKVRLGVLRLNRS